VSQACRTDREDIALVAVSPCCLGCRLQVAGCRSDAHSSGGRGPSTLSFFPPRVRVWEGRGWFETDDAGWRFDYSSYDQQRQVNSVGRFFWGAGGQGHPVVKLKQANLG